MAVSSRTLLEIAVPLLAVYFLVGAPAFSLPATVRDAIRAVFNSDAAATAAPPITQQNLDWALETLMLPTPNLTTACPAPHYTAHIYSADPLVLYLDNFIPPDEAAALARLAEPLYTPSTIFRAGAGAGPANHEARDAAVRNSERAPLPRTAAPAACIAERARALQGWPADLFVEAPWAQRYAPGGHYALHVDWSGGGSGGGGGAAGGRASSIMAWLGDACDGGGTHFPRLARREGAWCGRVACGPGAREGTTFEPRAGAAVYWENFRRGGAAAAREESWHAGLPVEAGEKIGLNIWSWWQPGLARAIDEETDRRKHESL